MGIMARYIDMLPEEAKDRVIQAQDWGVAEVVGSDRRRCLVGHAEDWRRLREEGSWWERMAEARPTGCAPAAATDEEYDFALSAGYFAFRRARPRDEGVYRRRLRQWGLASETRIGARFDRLCARRGVAGAVALVKARAARSFRPAREPAGAVRGPIATPDTAVGT